MARTRCAGPGPRRSFGGRRTCGPFSYCLATGLESTVRYLGVEVEDELEISKPTEAQGVAGRGESPSRTMIVLSDFGRSAAPGEALQKNPDTERPRSPTRPATRRRGIAATFGPRDTDHAPRKHWRPACDRYGASQLSRDSPGTRENSRTLSVTTVSPTARACAAINMSFGPIGVPCRSRRSRNSP